MLSLLFTSPGLASAPRLAVNGDVLNVDVPPVIENNRTLVALRTILEAVGAEVEWDQESKTVTASREGVVIRLVIGERTAWVDEQPVELDVPARIINGRTMVPLRFVGETLGAEVGWNPNSRTVTITEAGAKRDRLVFWLAADPHVGYSSSRAAELSTAVADVNNLQMADYALVLGDMVHDHPRFVSPFQQTMSGLNVVEWDYILGNHDYYHSTRQRVMPVNYWAQTYMGIRFIFISDETANALSRHGTMHPQQEAWFFRQLEEHSHMPVFVFSHQAPYGFNHWNITPRLKENINRYSIEAWFHGHEHRWHLERNSQYGFRKVGIAAIGGRNESYKSSFLILEDKGETTQVSVRFRNHRTGEWISTHGVSTLEMTVETPH